MRRLYIPFLAFLVLLLLTIPFSFDFATSVVPGWHTTIYPPYFLWTVVLSVILVFVIIGYWLLSKRVKKVDWALFIIHILATIPAVVFIKFPTLFLDVQQADPVEIIKDLELRLKLVPVAWALFITGQILFFVYFLRATNSKGRIP